MRLKDRVALITGAAGGQGRAAVLVFAREGAKVVASDLNGAGAEESARLAREAGGEAIGVRADVSDSAQVQAMVNAALETYGRIDVLYNNAGIGFSSSGRYTMANVVDTPEEHWDDINRINLKSVFLCCKYVIPHMVRQGAGAIVNNASIQALMANPGADAYTAAKGGIISLTRVLADEWGKHNIRVNCICPGSIDTPMIAGVLEISEYYQRALALTPLNRFGRPEETASVAAFLASDDASYVTGAIVPVDGGMLVR